MYRSQINKIISENIIFAENLGFMLPPFAKWTVDDWKSKGNEYESICKNGMGWDISDYGLGNFEKTGIVAFTIRNGKEKVYGFEKPYAEKLLFLEPYQEVPTHFHPSKIEDLINRGCVDLYIQLFNAQNDNSISTAPVDVYMDGFTFSVSAGSIITIKPGESITLMPRQYHKFWAENGKALLGEVTMTNNDHYFFDIEPSETKIIEDAKPIYFLTNEYPNF